MAAKPPKRTIINARPALVAPLAIDPDPTAPAFAGLRRRNMIACTSRSGSTYLCDALRPWGLDFAEWFNQYWRFGTQNNINNVTGYLEHLATHVAREGILSVKMALGAVPYLALGGQLDQGLDGWNIAFLRRRDIVRQAISRYVARRTGLWTAKMAATGSIQESDYDFDELHRSLHSILHENSQWLMLLDGLGLPWREVWHEDVLAGGDAYLADLAAFFGAPERVPAAEVIPPHTPLVQRPTNQSTDLNRIWAERFHADFRRRVSDEAAEAIAAGASPPAG